MRSILALYLRAATVMGYKGFAPLVRTLLPSLGLNKLRNFLLL